ncbi:MAG: hypothetical protein ACK58H_19110 [Planctomyces sp.]
MIARTCKQLHDSHDRLKVRRYEVAHILYGHQQGFEIGMAPGHRPWETRRTRYPAAATSESVGFF